MKDFDNWNRSKKKIDSRRYESEEVENIFEGDVFWAYLGLNIGKEIDGKSEYFSRPVYIYKKINKINFLAIPLTTSENYKDDWHLEIELENGKKSSLCFNQIKVIDFKRIKKLICSLDNDLVTKIQNRLDELYVKQQTRLTRVSSRDSRSVEGAGALDNSISDSKNKSSKFHFEIVKKSEETSLARAGVIHTPHGDIQTPAFIPVGTKATVKALDVEMIHKVGGQAVLANAYHLYLQPGEEIVRRHGGFAKMMGWGREGVVLPTFTDSGGFQVFSLGAAFDTGVSKIATSQELSDLKYKNPHSPPPAGGVRGGGKQMAFIDEEGVTFKSFIDGSSHRFTPERSMQIQHALGADIFFAFDECTSPLAPREYQVSAMERTHRWAERCIVEHKRLGVSDATGEQQALFAVVQGGAYDELRKESAMTLGQMNIDGVEFDGFGIGGSFTKEDMANTVKSATENLPEHKPRHLLGIGEPIDLFIGIEYGIDTFDCVSPTRVARHGNIHTSSGRINILNAKFRHDLTPLSDDTRSPYYFYTKSYLHHLFRAEEMLAATIASAHNLYFLINLTNNIRQSIIENNFFKFKNEFCAKYYASKK